MVSRARLISHSPGRRRSACVERHWRRDVDARAVERKNPGPSIQNSPESRSTCTGCPTSSSFPPSDASSTRAASIYILGRMNVPQLFRLPRLCNSDPPLLESTFFVRGGLLNVRTVCLPSWIATHLRKQVSSAARYCTATLTAICPLRTDVSILTSEICGLPAACLPGGDPTQPAPVRHFLSPRVPSYCRHKKVEHP